MHCENSRFWSLAWSPLKFSFQVSSDGRHFVGLSGGTTETHSSHPSLQPQVSPSHSRPLHWRSQTFLSSCGREFPPADTIRAAALDSLGGKALGLVGAASLSARLSPPMGEGSACLLLLAPYLLVTCVSFPEAKNCKENWGGTAAAHNTHTKIRVRSVPPGEGQR